MVGTRVTRLRVAALLVLLALASCAPRDVQEPARLQGRWVGSVSCNGESTPLALEVTGAADSLVAFLDAPALGVQHAPLGSLHFASPAIACAVPLADGDTLHLEGWFRRTILVGTLHTRAFGGGTRRATAPQFGFRRPVSVKGIAGVDSSLDETTPPAPVGPVTAHPDTLAHWLASHAGVR